MLQAGRPGFNSWLEQCWESLSSPAALGPIRPHIQWLPGLSPGVKRPRREADHSPTSSADVKNEWKYTSTPPTCLHGLVLSWAQGQIHLYVYLHFYAYLQHNWRRKDINGRFLNSITTDGVSRAVKRLNSKGHSVSMRIFSFLIPCRQMWRQVMTSFSNIHSDSWFR
jgi:hypothetical protein